MTDTDHEVTAEVVTGKMFLYKQPELLTLEDHGGLGLTPTDRPFDYAKTARAIPILQTEFGSAQRHYPIVFSSLENPMPLAVTGVLDEINLFVDASGHWDVMTYIPSYLRCYPLALATARETRMAAIIDRAAASISDEPQFPFFKDDELTENTRKMMEFCAQFEAERKRTREFCKRLQELDLLKVQQATFRPEGAEKDALLANYVSIDPEKLTNLPAENIVELHKNGSLSAMYLQLYSLENWRHLVARRVARTK